MSVTAAYLKVNSIVERIEKWIAVIIISAIVLIVFAGTVSRYILNDPFYGTDRLATYLMVWLGFIGFQIATSKMRHIEIEFLKAKVKPRTKYLMNIITSLLSGIFLFILSFISYQYMEESRALEDVDLILNIPIWWIILIIPVSCIMSAIRSMFSALLWYDVLQGKRKEEDIVQKQLL